MIKHHFTSIISVINVNDYTAAKKWYIELLGEPTIEPEETTGEWNIANHWLQVTENSEHVGHSVVILGSDDIAAQVKLCKDKGQIVSDIQDFGVIKLAELKDPDGNTIQIVEEVAQN